MASDRINHMPINIMEDARALRDLLSAEDLVTASYIAQSNELAILKAYSKGLL